MSPESKGMVTGYPPTGHIIVLVMLYLAYIRFLNLSGFRATRNYRMEGRSRPEKQIENL